MDESRIIDVSTANAKNMNSPPEEDFGNDFLSSWKLPKSGKDTKRTDKFNFGNLDDFGLDGAFDKLPPFKMGMSDLDISSPLKKTVKHNTSNGDFNELVEFSLDAKLGIEEKSTSKVTGKADPVCSNGNKGNAPKQNSKHTPKSGMMSLATPFDGMLNNVQMEVGRNAVVLKIGFKALRNPQLNEYLDKFLTLAKYDDKSTSEDIKVLREIIFEMETSFQQLLAKLIEENDVSGVGEMEEIKTFRSEMITLVGKMKEKYHSFEIKDDLNILMSIVQQIQDDEIILEKKFMMFQDLLRRNEHFESSVLEPSTVEMQHVDYKKLVDENVKLRQLLNNSELKNKMLMDENMKHQEGLMNSEKLRQKYLNELLDLEGTIRVFCRVRPSLSCDLPALECRNDTDIQLKCKEKYYSFNFHKIFDHSASQNNVFDEVSQLVHKSVDGAKVAIFVYGQTGSGKTHTMLGNPNSSCEKGIISRSFEMIFEMCMDAKVVGWQYQIKVSIGEVYNNKLYDLYNPSNGISKMHIGNQGITDEKIISVIELENVEKASSILELAMKNRSISETKINKSSSRSHFLLTLRIFGENKIIGKKTNGFLSLIDLAGNDDKKESGVSGKQEVEADEINKSLWALREVIRKKINNEFDSCREYALTRLVKPFFEREAKTLIMVNLSPEESSAERSLTSLKFADVSMTCKID